jgi:hypothetical protein
MTPTQIGDALIDEAVRADLYHGTSSIHLDDIILHGLRDGYVTTDLSTAHQEAHHKVHGDDWQPGSARGQGVGGHPVVLKIDRNHPSARAARYTGDPEFGSSGVRQSYFKSSGTIHPEAISVVPDDKLKNTRFLSDDGMRSFSPDEYVSGTTTGGRLQPGKTYKSHSSEGEPYRGKHFTVLSKLGEDPMGGVTYRVRHSDGTEADHETHHINVYIRQ